MKWSVRAWTPKRGNEKFEVEAPDSKKAIIKAKKQIRWKNSGEVNVTPYKEKKGRSVKDTPKKGASSDG